MNMTKCDLALQLHFALFRGSDGFVLKPDLMRSVQPGAEGQECNDDAFWPLARASLHRVTIECISLHQLPKVRGPFTM
jgi:hypothetical protein